MKCLYCGREFKPTPMHPSQKFCSRFCYEKNRSSSAPKKKKPQGKLLSQWAAEAAECNLDYGTYRGLLNAGKTFEELKATAYQRTLSTHAKLQGQHALLGEKLG